MKIYKFQLGKGVYVVQSSDEKVQNFLHVLQEFASYMHILFPSRAPEFDSFLYSVINTLDSTQLDVDTSQLDVAAMDA